MGARAREITRDGRWPLEAECLLGKQPERGREERRGRFSLTTARELNPASHSVSLKEDLRSRKEEQGLVLTSAGLQPCEGLGTQTSDPSGTVRNFVCYAQAANFVVICYTAKGKECSTPSQFGGSFIFPLQCLWQPQLPDLAPLKSWSG